ncbi:facilitated trehalose transporter Tret1-like [Rhodnius prolixus]|uniref:Putative transporter major facilitator superfamily n=1 Tax=Rhodnius prolixus TaxID=13249 RepID=R4FN36_RHOPR
MGYTSLVRQVLASLSCYLCVMTGSFCFYWLSPYTIKLTSGENPIFATETLVKLISITEIGEAIGCIPTALFSDRFGRRTSLLLIGPLTAILWIISLFTKNMVVLYIIRILQGVVVAAVETIGPVYLAEISGAKIRGALCGYYTVFWNFGIMCAFMVSDYLPFDLYTGALIAVPTLFCITFFFMPESPYYYFIRNQSVNGKKSLKWLRHGEDIEVECKEIEEAVREDMKNDGSWKDLIATKKDRRALLIVLIVSLSRYMVGVGTFLAYAEDVFHKAGSDIFTPNQQSIFLALIFVVAGAVASFFSDTVGRRKLLIYSLICTVISIIIIAVYFGLLELTSIQVTPYIWVMYVGILGYCSATTVGLGQLMPTVKAEFFPSHTRSKGGAVTNLIASFAVFLQLFLFPMITTYIGMYFNFVLFAAFALIGFFLALIYIPESAGKTLSEVNQTVINITYS